MLFRSPKPQTPNPKPQTPNPIQIVIVMNFLSPPADGRNQLSALIAMGGHKSSFPDDKDSRQFAFEMHDDSIKVGLLRSKAMAVAKVIHDMLHDPRIKYLGPTENECQSCRNSFIIFFRKRYCCSRCEHSFCQKCVRYQLIIDCERLYHDTVSNVSNIIDFYGKHARKNSFVFQICSECFNYAILDLGQLDKTHQSKKLKKLESTLLDTLKSTPRMLNTHRASPINSSPINRRVRHFGSFHATSCPPGPLEGKPSLNGNKLYEAAMMQGLHQIPAIVDLATSIEKLKISDAMATSILDSFVVKLLSLDFNEDLPHDLAIDQLVKIFAVNSDAPFLHEDNADPDIMKQGRIKTINGTIVQRVLRFKDYIEDEAVNNILLLSLPITNPVKAIDNEAQRFDASDFIDMLDLSPIREDLPDEGLIAKLANTRSNLTSFANRETTTFSGSVNSRARTSFNEDMYVSLDSLSYVKRQFCSYLQDHIAKNQIELIFSTETLPSSLFEQLKHQGVVVIFPVSHSEMKLLSVVLKAKVVDDISLITKDLDQSYLGNIKKYNLINIYETEGRYQTSLIYMDKLEPAMQQPYTSLGVTIWSSDDHQNSEVKKLLKDILPYLYFSLTEHEFAIRESESIALPLSSTEIISSQVGDMRSHLSQSMPLKSAMVGTNKIFELTEVTVESMTVNSAYPDIDSEYASIIDKFFDRITTLEGIKHIQGVKSRVEQSIMTPQEYDNFNYLFNTDLDFMASLNITKNDSIMRITSTPKYQSAMPYSEGDMTLMKYIRQKVKQFEDTLTHAHHDWNHRQSLFYIGKACVKVNISISAKYQNRLGYAKDFHELEKFEQHQRGLTATLLYNEINAFLGAHKLVKSLQSNGSVTAKQAKSKLSRRSKKIKQSMINLPRGRPNLEGGIQQVRSFAKCDLCGKQLSASMTMNGIHKNMSFLMFLYSIAHKKKTSANWKKSNHLNASYDVDTQNLSPTEPDHDEYCVHQNQTRVFQQGLVNVSFQRFDVSIHKLMHFKHRDNILKKNSVVSQINKTYHFDKMQYEDKMAKEFGEYYIRQISLLTYIARDLILKGHEILGKDRSGKYRQNFYHQLKFIKLFSVLCDIVSKLWFVMNNFGQESDLNTKYNQLLRSIMLNIKLYDQTLEDIHQHLFGETSHDKRASYYADVTTRLCKMNKEYSVLLNPNVSPVPNNKRMIIHSPVVVKEFLTGKESTLALGRESIDRNNRDFPTPVKEQTMSRESITPVDSLLTSDMVMRRAYSKQTNNSATNKKMMRSNTLTPDDEDMTISHPIAIGGVESGSRTDLRRPPGSIS